MTRAAATMLRLPAVGLCIAVLGLPATGLGNEVITALKGETAPLYQEPRADRNQATVVSELQLVSDFIPIAMRRDDWIAIQALDDWLWLHKDDVVVMRAPRRPTGSASCQPAAGRTLC